LTYPNAVIQGDIAASPASATQENERSSHTAHRLTPAGGIHCRAIVQFDNKRGMAEP